MYPKNAKINAQNHNHNNKAIVQLLKPSLPKNRVSWSESQIVSVSEKS